MIMVITRFSSFLRLFPLIIFIPFILFAQPSKEIANKTGINLFEVNLLPDIDSVNCYVSFHIPYNQLIFVRSQDNFSGGVKLFFDIKLNNKIDSRKYYAKSVKVSSYEETQSKDKFIEGLIDIKLARKDYIIQPSLKIENTNQTINLDSLTINLSRIDRTIFYRPIVVEKIINSCLDLGLYQVVNRSNKIPFSAKKYILFVPVKSDSIKEVLVKIEQPGKTVFEKNIPVQSSEKLKIAECDESIIITMGGNLSKTNFILIENVTPSLNEGPVTIKLISVQNEDSYTLSVDWINKPFVLSNINLAIELLELIYDKAELLDLYKSSNQNKYKNLVEFWNKKYPEREYQFNEWMEEFYKRADYAMTNFSNLANQVGAKTDRGKIYILYGQPDEIKRDYSSVNNVVETWLYKDLQKEFVFIDKTGLGNYLLSK